MTFPIVPTMRFATRGSAAPALLPTTGWTASASRYTSDAPANMLDGNNGTRWATGGAMAYSGGTPDWAAVNMGAVYHVSKVILNDSSFSGDLPQTGDVQYWNGSSWVTITSWTLTDIVGGIMTADFSGTPVDTSQLKIIATGPPTGASSNWMSIGEFQVWGT